MMSRIRMPAVKSEKRSGAVLAALRREGREAASRPSRQARSAAKRRARPAARRRAARR